MTDDYRFDRFHQVVFLVMGWMNAHLHEFQMGDRKIGMLLNDGFDVPGVEDETKIFLHEMNFKEGDKLLYLYDFGDNWEHLLQVEQIAKGTLASPSCLNGENACPPEDCGGIPMYNEMVRMHRDLDASPDEDAMLWLPEDFSPTVFDIEAVNAELAKFGAWHRQHPRAKSSPWHQLS